MAEKSYKVVGAVAVVEVGKAARYLYRGAVVPGSAANLKHLLAVGLIAEAEAEEEVGDQAVDIDTLGVEGLRAYAADHNVDLGGLTRKDDIRAAILAASA